MLKLPGYYDTEYQKGIGKNSNLKDLKPLKPFDKRDKLLKSQPFDSNSTYRDHYRENPLNYKPYKRNEKLNDLKTPLDCRTIYRQEYIPHEFDKNPRKHGDRGNPNIKHGYVDKPISQYGNSYPAYGPEAYMKEDCPINIMPPRPGRPSPGRNHLYYNDDIVNWD